MVEKLMVHPILMLGMLVMLTGCGNSNGQPAAPAAPVAGIGQVPAAPVSTTATIPSTGSTAATTKVTTNGTVVLAPGDSTGLTPAAAAAIGVGLLTSANSAEAKAFRAGPWATLSAKYSARGVNFWILDVDLDKQQAQYLGWKGVVPTMIVTRGKTPIQMIEGAKADQLTAALDPLAPAK